MYLINSNIASLELLKESINGLDNNDSKKTLEKKIAQIKSFFAQIGAQADYCKKNPRDLVEKDRLNCMVTEFCEKIGESWATYQESIFSTCTKIQSVNSYSNNEVRNLKVLYHDSYRYQDYVPKIILQGKWLKNIGFKPEEYIKIIGTDNFLMIGKRHS